MLKVLICTVICCYSVTSHQDKQPAEPDLENLAFGYLIGNLKKLGIPDSTKVHSSFISTVDIDLQYFFRNTAFQEKGVVRLKSWTRNDSLRNLQRKSFYVFGCCKRKINVELWRTDEKFRYPGGAMFLTVYRRLYYDDHVYVLVQIQNPNYGGNVLIKFDLAGEIKNSYFGSYIY